MSRGERRRTLSVDDAQWRAQRLEWRFLRSGSEGHDTRLYVNLSVAQRESLQSLGAVREHELAVVATVRDAETMSLVTTRRVLWARGGQRGQVSLAAITDATVLPGHFAAAGTPPRRREGTISMSPGRGALGDTCG